MSEAHTNDPFDDYEEDESEKQEQVNVPAAPHVDESAPAGQARRVPDGDPPF